MRRPRLTHLGDVVDFTGPTKGPIDPTVVADGARELESILVLGWDKNGEFYIASSSPEPSELILLIELGRKTVLEPFDEEQT